MCMTKAEIFLILLSLATISSNSLSSAAVGCFSSIFSFGDSITDTGNHCYLQSKSGKLKNNCFLPYGETFFHRPTGRSCDGRLIIDFIAEHLGLPLVRPYFGGSSKDFDGGVNFAVGTATALETSFLGTSDGTNVSLRVQLDLFRQLLPSLCRDDKDESDGFSRIRHASDTPSEIEIGTKKHSGCKQLLRKSLFLLGEIGGNDYNLPLADGHTLQQMHQLVPIVIRSISSALQEIIELGAVNILIPGNFPIGCTPFYLNRFPSSNSSDYDPSTGCLTPFNQLSEYHNELLRAELNRVRQAYPDINIIYVDYYNAVLRIYDTPNNFGFNGETLRACCDGEGSLVQCGSPPVEPCDDPWKYVSWDGLHYTEATYGLIVKSIMEQGFFTEPPFNASASCVASNSGNHYFPTSSS